MAPLPIPSAFLSLLEVADASLEVVDAMELAGKMRAALPKPADLTAEERRGAIAELQALELQRPYIAEGNPWGIYWGPTSGFVDGSGNMHYSPDALSVGEDMVAHWIHRSETLRHPELRARFADLAWEIGRLLRDRSRKDPAATPWTLEISHALAQRAVDSSLQAAFLHFEDDFHGWRLLARALALAIALNDRDRTAHAKQALFRYRRLIHQRGRRYRRSDFDDITWEQSKALALSSEEEREVIQNLEDALAGTASAQK